MTERKLATIQTIKKTLLDKINNYLTIYYINSNNFDNYKFRIIKDFIVVFDSINFIDNN